MTFSVFAIAMIFALMPLVLSQTRSESTNRSMNELRAAAEMGIDYGIKQLNDFAAKNTGGTDSFDLNTTTVPSTYLNGITTNTVKVRVSAISSSNWKKFGAIYSDHIDGPSGINPLLDPSKDTWRVLDSTASNGFLSKSVRVFLEPRYDISPRNLSPGGGTTPLQSYFNNSMLSAGDLELIPNPSGSLTLSTYTPGSSAPTTVSTPQGAKVNVQNTVTVTGTLTTSEPTISIPTTATVTNTDTSVAIDPLPQAPEAGTAVPLPPSSSNSVLEQGSYTTGSLNNTSTSATVNSPVKIFIQDNSPATSAVDISSANIKNVSSEAAGGSKNLQIWYDGSRPINISMVDGSPFKGLIYAPNSHISLNGNGQFIGAMVGKKITMNPAGDLDVKIDTTVQDPASLGSSGKGLSYTLDSNNHMFLQGYKAVAWKEFSGTLVP
ncbi:MAG: hypothetical protein WCT03_06120 [Candidatus Obscuribacterales bacterium]